MPQPRPSARRRSLDGSSSEDEPLLSNGVSPEEEPNVLGATAEASLLGDPSRQPTSLFSAHTHDKRSRALEVRIAAAMFSFFVMGLIQSTVGLEDFYGLSDTLVSLTFLMTPLGYFLAAYVNSIIHLQFGQRGVAVIGPASQLLFVSSVSFHPRYSIFLLFSVIGGFGTGLLDGSWCAWAGGMAKNANVIQGFLHGSYSVGASLGPFMAGTMLSVGGKPWWSWYYVLSAFCLTTLVTSALAFWSQDADKYHAEKYKTPESSDSASKKSPWDMFKHIATWVCAAYFLAYVGIENSITGWIVVFMIRVRGTSPYLASICSSLFNIGMVVGRLGLGVVTEKHGVRRAVIVYLLLAAIFQVLFAVIDVPAVSAVLITMIGVLLGPLFPSGVIMVTRLLPQHLHVDAVSFVASVGEVGGALLPFALGVIADGLGIGSFQYIIIAQLVATLCIWMCFPKLSLSILPQVNAIRDDETRDE
ncbi:hypothetical protein JX265_006876 [Neoarthrinium moseri]|uniref:Major facilitator superfamily (MFS) profile domain-containing protein n=1 Tax=Neoarthrinium moseri TaxID=1658444 RepID=A0A9Q0AQE7_9PEZI|nr:hypothetical protein JX266_011534 [Neoarthrinium moseri]KAI1868897.1 hypothetical protein JX265_006876 [Neoarthrinium moseri]